MTQATNDQFLLAARPVGMPKDSDWQRATPALAELAEGEVRVKILYLSLDPAMRGWMNDARPMCARSPSAK
jgi:NADPH-dependent curcumin reductase CurA